MARILSALVLIPLVVAVVWFGGYPGLVLLAVVASVLGFLEYVTIASALGARVPKVTGALGVAAACLATNVAGRPSDVVMNDRIPIAPGALDAVVMLALVVAGTRA